MKRALRRNEASPTRNNGIPPSSLLWLLHTSVTPPQGERRTIWKETTFQFGRPRDKRKILTLHLLASAYTKNLPKQSDEPLLSFFFFPKIFYISNGLPVCFFSSPFSYDQRAFWKKSNNRFALLNSNKIVFDIRYTFTLKHYTAESLNIFRITRAENMLSHNRSGTILLCTVQTHTQML